MSVCLVKLSFATNLDLDTNRQIHHFENNLHNPLIVINESQQYFNIYDEMKKYHVPVISVAMITDGKLAWVRNYHTGIEQVDNNTLFQAGSISKVLTTIATLKLSQEHKIDIDNNVNNYIYGWKVPRNKFTESSFVTPKQLMSHTGCINVAGFDGISRNVNPLPSIIDVLNGEKPYMTTPPVTVMCYPGSQFNYSGGGMSILELLIDSQTNEGYPRWMSSNILSFIGMNNSNFQQPLSNKMSKFAVCGHDLNGKEIDGCWHNYPEHGAAGLWSTSSDLSKLIIALMNSYYGESSTLPLNTQVSKLMFKETGSYGIGLGIGIQNINGLTVLNHDGSVDGYKSSMIGFVNENQESKNKFKDGIVVMTNGENGWNLYPEIIASLTDTYKIPYSLPIKITSVKVDGLNSYSGSYKLKNNLDPWGFTLNPHNDNLYVNYGKGIELRLFFTSNEIAYAQDGTKFNFVFKNNQLLTILVTQYQSNDILEFGKE